MNRRAARHRRRWSPAPRLDGLEPRQLLTGILSVWAASPTQGQSHVVDIERPATCGVAESTATFTITLGGTPVHGTMVKVDYVVTDTPDVDNYQIDLTSGSSDAPFLPYKGSGSMIMSPISSSIYTLKAPLIGTSQPDQDVTLTITSAREDCGTGPALILDPASATIKIKGVTAPIVCPTCPPAPVASTADPGSGVATPQATSDGGVTYYGGGVRVGAPALLQSGGFGSTPTGVGLGWTNLSGYRGVEPPSSGAAAFGRGMLDSDLPMLQGNPDGTVAALRSAGTVLTFDYNYTSGSTKYYTTRHFSKDALTFDTINSKYTLAQADGSVLTFYALGSPSSTSQGGQIASYADAAGNATTYNYTGGGLLTSVQRTDGTTTEAYAYTYVGGTGPNADLVANIALQRGPYGGTLATVQQVAFAYYDGTQAHGDTRDLRSETLEDAAGTAIGTTFFRYYTVADLAAGAPGYAEGLKYQFDPQSYARLVAYLATLPGGLTPDTATDAQVAAYAARYYEYDVNHRVAKATLQGAGCSCAGSTGQGTYTYAYADNTSPGTGYNAWVRRTVETRPDGNQNIVYTNAAGEVMLSAFSDVSDAGNSALNGKLWATAYRYDAAGRLVLTAQPSAVTITTTTALSSAASTYADIVGYNAGAGTYANLSSGSGRIDLVDYGAGTTATSTTAGDVAGYLKDDKVQDGYAATAILTDAVQYFSRTSSGGSTTYPAATSTAYRNTDGTGAEVTSYAYAWYSGTDQMQSETVSLPVIASTQDGPGTADVTTTFYDVAGRPTWIKDGDGHIAYTAFDNATGGVTRTIADVNTTQTTDFTGLPPGWASPAGPVHSITLYQVDGLGRTTRVNDAVGRITYVVYDDVNHAVRTYRGWDATTGTATGPTEVTRIDYPGNYTETLTMSATPAVSGTAGNYVPTGTEAIAGIQALSRDLEDNAGRVVEQDNYASLSSATYSTTSLRLGTLGTNYYATYHGFDAMGRPARTVSPTGTITDTTYDSLGRVASVAVGTDDTYTPGPTGPSNMVQVAADQYDANGVGDGNLTQATRYPDAVAADARVTAYAYDWRDRLVATKSGVQSTEGTTVHRPITYYDLDNLGEVTGVSQFDGDGVTLTNAKPSASLLRAYTVTSYDDQGRVYQVQQYDVNQSTGAVSTSALTTNAYRDHRGDVIEVAAPGGLVTKSTYDGAGRLVEVARTDGAGGTAWSNAGSTAGDHVLEETITSYNGAGDVILTGTRQRFDTDTSADTGELGTPTTGVKARVYYVAFYYDAAGRPTARADVGTYGGSVYTAPTLGASPPARSDTALVTSYTYNAAGWVATVTDPRGIVTATSYDLLGRTTQVIAGYNASINGGNPTSSANATTNYTYDGSGHTLTVTAVMPTGTAGQTTTYVYGVGSTGNLYSNDLLAATVQPDKTTGAYPSPANLPGDEKVSTYNFLGQQTGLTDENGTVHAYAYDVLGRQVSDAVTTLGTGVDGAVRLITTAYDTGDRPYLFTTYNAATGGSIVNQVQRAFNGLGQLTGEYQEHTGAVVIGTTPEVQYAYNQMAGGANNSRLTSMTYPSGRKVDYVYNSGIDAAISRLSAVADDASGSPGTTLEGYIYLGLGTIVTRAHPQPGVDLTYVQQSSDSRANADGGDRYTGLDRFGRVIDQNWVTGDGTTSWAAVDRFQYGYDRGGDRLYQANLINAALSELYHANSTTSGDNNTAYDALGRLVAFRQGTLSASGYNGTGLDTIASPSAWVSWSLDALGNWAGRTAGGTTVTEGFNAQNQEISTSSGTASTYDAAGNTITSGAGQAYVYDAWNHSVAVKAAAGGATLATYADDALGRRVVEYYASTGTTNHLYYSPQWQVIEERQGGTVASNLHYQYVWGQSYIDDLVLRDTYSGGSLTQRLYATTDANYDVTALVSTAGAAIERYLYDPYGAVTITNASYTPLAGNVSAYGWHYLHQGGRLDGVSGWYDFRNRDEIASQGTWAERDPLGLNGQSDNLYVFCSTDPIVTNDAYGLAPSRWPNDPIHWDPAASPTPRLHGNEPPNPLIKDNFDKGKLPCADLLNWIKRTAQSIRNRKADAKVLDEGHQDRVNNELKLLQVLIKLYHDNCGSKGGKCTKEERIPDSYKKIPELETNPVLLPLVSRTPPGYNNHSGPGFLNDWGHYINPFNNPPDEWAFMRGGKLLGWTMAAGAGTILAGVYLIPAGGGVIVEATVGAGSVMAQQGIGR